MKKKYPQKINSTKIITKRNKVYLLKRIIISN